MLPPALEDISVFVAALRQLRSGLNEAYREAEILAFLAVSLLTVNNLKLRVRAVCVTYMIYIVRRTHKMATIGRHLRCIFRGITHHSWLAHNYKPEKEHLQSEIFHLMDRTFVYSLWLLSYS